MVAGWAPPVQALAGVPKPRGSGTWTHTTVVARVLAWTMS